MITPQFLRFLVAGGVAAEQTLAHDLSSVFFLPTALQSF